MTEWREVPEINESHIGWTVAYGTERYTIAIQYGYLFQEENGGRLKTKGPWLVKPPEKEKCDIPDRYHTPEFQIKEHTKDDHKTTLPEKPKPEPWGFWWVKDKAGWQLNGPWTRQEVINACGGYMTDLLPAKLDKDGKFYPPEQ